MSGSLIVMTKPKLAGSGLAMFALLMLGMGSELFAAREVKTGTTRILLPAIQSERLQQRAAIFSRKADSNWNEAIAKNRERSREYLERFNKDGFVSQEQEAYMEELAKERKPVHAAKGFEGK